MSKTKEATAIGGESPTSSGDEYIGMRKPYRVMIKIEGVCPLIFHRYQPETVREQAKGPKGSKIKKTDNVESYLWRNSENELCLPGEYLRRSIIEVSKYEQDPRSPRKSLRDLMSAALVSLTPLATLGVKEPDFLDSRRVRIQRDAITRVRPAINEGWKATFCMQMNLPEYVEYNKLNYLTQQSGRLQGVGDFRPSYGRFNVIGFELMDDDQ